MSDSLWPNRLQHARFPCPSLSPRVCSDSRPWVSDAIQPSHPLPPSSFALSLSEHQSFPVNWLSTSGVQSIGTSVSVLPMNIQGWFPSGLTGLISLQSWDSQESFPAQLESIDLLYGLISHIATWLRGKPQIWLHRPLSEKWSLCFWIRCLGLSWLSFQGGSKHLWLSWLQSLSAVILESRKRKSCCFYFSPFCLLWSDGTGCHDLSFLNVEF